ncbi:MAG: HD domain-containing phosphohydrolase [Myxococcales bacterium]
MRRKDAFRSHSAAVAKHSRTIAQRMGLEHRTVNHITIAAYLHDLGKRPDRHFTLVSTAENEEWRTDAKRYYKAPVKLFETVHLPVEVNSILAQLFEAYDGSGFPQGAKGDSIPAGARILAAVDAYEDLAKNAQNVYGKALDKDEAIARIRDRVGTLFDPTVVDLMLQIHSGDILKQRLLSEGRQVVVSHSDEGTRTDLKDSLTKLGLITNATASNEGIYDALRNGEADLYVAEVVPPDEESLAIVAPLRREPATVGLPAIFLAAKADPNLADRVAALRPAELITGEIDPDQVAARAKALLDDRQAAGAPGRIVAGMLDEMSLPDVLKNISIAKRSGRLLVRGTGKQGEIFIDKGRVVHVVCGATKGEPAFDQNRRGVHVRRLHARPELPDPRAADGQGRRHPAARVDRAAALPSRRPCAGGGDPYPDAHADAGAPQGRRQLSLLDKLGMSVTSSRPAGRQPGQDKPLLATLVPGDLGEPVALPVRAQGPRSSR